MFVFDSHAHIIPKLNGKSGYSSIEEHLLISQRAMHDHLSQPARRIKDHKIVKKSIWNENIQEYEGRLDVNFRVGKYGRFEWTQDSEDCYIQYLPTYAENMEYPAQELKIMMDYAGIDKAVLQCGSVYGNLNDYYRDVICKNEFLSSILYPLLRIKENDAFKDQQLKELTDYINNFNLKGIWFIANEKSFTNQFKIFWDIVKQLRIPIFFPFFPDEKWMDRALILERFIENYSEVPCILPQAFPLSTKITDDNLIVNKKLKNIILSANIYI